MRKVIFINSHPIQYFAPLYKYLCDNGVPTECWYCSDENLRGHVDRQFGTTVTWDTPLLEGYTSRFFKNYALRPSLYHGFFGLFNPGMIKALLNEKPAIIVVHGWAYVTHALVLMLARLAGHTICVRGESPLNQELMKSSFVRFVKRLLLGKILFKAAHYCLFIGKQNRAFYQYYGVKAERLMFTPYVVDNAFFQHMAQRLQSSRTDIRQRLGIADKAKVILFAAKLIEKKRPLDLLKAYQRLEVADKSLMIVGDGELRDELQRFVVREQLPNVHFAGFVNQSVIGQYYAGADVFVLCSGEGETWGLSVNEALNFDLPVVVSDTAGCADDLVKEGRNGFVFKTGDHLEMAVKIAASLDLGRPTSSKVLDVHSFRTVTSTLRSLADRPGSAG
jgi:glycosyltransferase involved in cell wall biosynthesis